MIAKAASAALTSKPGSGMMGLKTLSSTVGVALRGGATTPILQDFSSCASEYFSGIRTPASLILGASLGALFTYHSDVDDMRQKSQAERLCTRLYNTLVLASFVLSFCTTTVATAAGVTIMHQNAIAKAESAYQLLMRDFEFEFITCRLSYLASLLSFVMGITCRILLEFKLLHKSKREEACVVCFSMGAIVTHLWSYINSTLYTSQSLFSLAICLFQIMLRRAFYEHRPLQIASLTCSTLATYFLIKVLFFKKKGAPHDVIL